MASVLVQSIEKRDDSMAGNILNLVRRAPQFLRLYYSQLYNALENVLSSDESIPREHPFKQLFGHLSTLEQAGV